MASRCWALPLAVPVVFLVAASKPVSAVTLNCVARDAVFERLRETKGEVPSHAGLAANGSLLEVTVNPDGSWTAFFTFPDGLTCPFATGEAWRDIAEPVDDPAA